MKISIVLLTYTNIKHILCNIISESSVLAIYVIEIHKDKGSAFFFMIKIHIIKKGKGNRELDLRYSKEANQLIPN